MFGYEDFHRSIIEINKGFTQELSPKWDHEKKMEN